MNSHLQFAALVRREWASATHDRASPRCEPVPLQIKRFQNQPTSPTWQALVVQPQKPAN